MAPSRHSHCGIGLLNTLALQRRERCSIAVAQSAGKAAGIVIRAARVGSSSRRFFPRHLEAEGDGETFNTLLSAVLDENALAWWQTAVQYQMWHATGLIALGAARLPRSLLPAVLLTAGTIIFAGTLYAMALGGPRWLGAVTPVGGSLMIAGWLVLAWRVLRSTPRAL